MENLGRPRFHHSHTSLSQILALRWENFMDCPSSLAEFFCHPINFVINELANPLALQVACTLSGWTRSSFSWITSSVFEGVKKMQGNQIPIFCCRGEYI